MNKTEPHRAFLHSAYIARLHAARPNDTIAWGFITAVWFHIAGAAIMMNTRISALNVFKEYQAEEPFIMVQHLLQTGMEPGGIIELTRRAEEQRDRESLNQPVVPEPLDPTVKPVPHAQLPLEPERPISEDNDRAVEFVRVDKPGETPVDPSIARIAQHDSTAREERRTPILSKEAGELAPHYDELAARRDDGQAGLDSPQQHDEAMMGVLKAERSGERRVRVGRDGSEAGAASSGVTAGSPGQASGQEGLDGGVRATRQLKSQGGASAGEALAPDAGGYRLDANPTHSVRRKAPETWNPSVYRFRGSATRGNSTVAPQRPPSPRIDDPPSPRPRIDVGRTKGRKTDGKAPAAGGSTTSEQVLAPLPKPTRNEPKVEVRALGPDELDPVSKLREDLGWEGIVTQPQDVRKGTVGLVGSDGSRSASPQTVLPEEYPFASEVAVAAVRTELGVYLHDVDQRIGRAWNEVDLPMEERALGIQGRVILTIQIRASGKVARLQVVASSGNARLDEMARKAIPRRFKAFPKALELDGIAHKITLRYSNPLILRGAD